MSELILTRSMPPDTMEVTGDGWTVYGLAVPYGVTQRVTDDGRTFYREGFAAGAFSRDADKGGRWVNLYLGHSGDNGQRYVGRCIGLEDRPDGLWPTFRLNRESDAAEAARSGEFTGWSVSAHVYRSREVTDADGPIVWRELCGLDHVAATARPQYAGAGVRVARDHQYIGAPPPRPLLEALRRDGFGTRRG
jgi:hypothetical protein